MKAKSLLLLRVSLGLFLAAWGLDKLVNVEHGVAVSEGFYLGLVSSRTLLRAFGVVQVLAGALVILGLWRRAAYPFLLLVTAATLLAVWKSILDPLGLYLEGANLVFFASAPIFTAALALWAFRDEDVHALDHRLRPSAARPAPAPPAAGGDGALTRRRGRTDLCGRTDLSLSGEIPIRPPSLGDGHPAAYARAAHRITFTRIRQSANG